MDEQLLEKPVVKISIGAVIANAFHLFRRYLLIGVVYGIIGAALNVIIDDVPFISHIAVVKAVWMLILNPLLVFGFIVLIDKKERRNDLSTITPYMVARLAVKVLVTYWITWLIVILGLLLFIVPGIIFYAMFSMSAYFILLKGTGVREAFTKSRKLTAGSRTQILLILVLLVFMYFVLHIGLFLLSGGIFYRSMTHYYINPGPYTPYAVHLIYILLYPFGIFLGYSIWRGLLAAQAVRKKS